MTKFKRLLIALVATNLVLLAAGVQALPPEVDEGSAKVDAPLQYPPDPLDPPDYTDDNIAWTTGGLTGRDAVQYAFNHARHVENDRVRVGPIPDIPDMTLPEADVWDEMTDGAKALWLINSEREDRGGLPLDGLNEDLMQVAQDYADWLVANDEFGHNENDSDMFTRITARIPATRIEGMSENIGYDCDEPLLVERTLYVWLYEDCCYCRVGEVPPCWDHRHNLLSEEYTENVCPAGQEGFFGIGRAGANGYQNCSATSYGDLLVWDAIDPSTNWPDTPVFTSGAPPSPAQVGVNYSHTFAATGYPDPTFALMSGALPLGLQLNATTGVLSGTPTTGGSWTFTIGASNGCDQVAQQVTIQVTGQAATAPTITSGPPTSPVLVGDDYHHTFTATGDPAPTFAVVSGNLPPGLHLNGTTGALTGTPTAAGSYTFTVRASNGVAPADTQQVTIVVEHVDSPVFTSDPPGPGEVDTPYNHTFTATGDPAPTYQVTSGELPQGLTLDENTGVLSGTPTTAGEYTFTVTASNGVAPDATQRVTIPVVEQFVPPEIDPDQELEQAQANEFYSDTVEAEGSPPPDLEIGAGSPPPGLEMDQSGWISGTPTLPGSWEFEIVADNGVPPTDTMDAVIIVAPAKPRVYLPIVVKGWRGENWETEPNDEALTEANGPLASGTAYHGEFPTGDDLKDCYYFDMAEKHTVEIWLSDIPHDHDYDLQLTDKDLNELEKSSQLGTDSEHILSGELEPGRYYIRVLNEGQSGSTESYKLLVVYEW